MRSQQRGRLTVACLLVWHLGGGPPGLCAGAHAEGCWQVLFQSADPGRWGTTFGTPGTGEWGLGPATVPGEINQLRFTRMDTGQSLTIPISLEGLYSCGPVGEGWIWDGTGSGEWNAIHLGISSTEHLGIPCGHIITSASCNLDRRSWGFGHKGCVNDGQYWGWESLDIGRPTVFQIAVAGTAHLVTDGAPVLCVPLSSQSAPGGGVVEFVALAGGKSPLTWQWQRDGIDLQDAERISGSKSGSLRISPVTPQDSGSYTVTIRNEYGSITSASATLTVILGPPDLVTDPEDQTVTGGADARFSVIAAGSLPLNYQWYRNGVPLSDGPRLTGAQSATLTLANAQPEDPGFYWVEVRNEYGVTESFPALLAVTLVPPQITGEPQAQSVALRSTVTLRVEATGSLPLRYRWERDGVAVQDGEHTSGADTSMLTLSDLSIADLGAYNVLVWNGYGTVHSAAALVSTYSPILHIAPDGDQLVVSWNSAARGMTLQTTGSLDEPEWTGVTGSESVTSLGLPIQQAGSLFFRLAAFLPPPPQGMVAWWPGDGHARDLLGANHGVLTHGATFAPGMVGEGFLFDGNDDVVVLPCIEGLKTAMTVDAWISPVEPLPYQANLFGQPMGGPQFRLIAGSQLAIGYMDASWDFFGEVIGTNAIPMDGFSHVAGTFDGAHLKVYLNGDFVGQHTLTTPLASSTCPLMIGGFGDSPGSETCRGSGPQQHYRGVIDEVHLFNRALSAGEVRSIYEAGRLGLLKPVL